MTCDIRTAARQTKDGKPIAMPRLTTKPLDKQAQQVVEGSNRELPKDK